MIQRLVSQHHGQVGSKKKSTRTRTLYVVSGRDAIRARSYPGQDATRAGIVTSPHEPPMGPMKPQLGGVLISTAVDRFAELRSFYVDALDLAPKSDRPGFVNFELGRSRLTIALHTEVSGRNLQPARMMMNLIVEDLDGAFHRAIEHGARVVRPPEPESWGGRICTLVDPDDNFVQLMTPDPRDGPDSRE